MTPTNTIEKKSSMFWGAALAALCVWTIWSIGGFDLTGDLPDGTTVPNTYATVDHPFHASRASVVLDALRDGELVRWMGSHQGGYPVEFYPLGVAWIDVLLYGLSFGTVSILALHKLAVAIVFVLPALAYWLLVRADRLHPSAAFLAFAIHVAVPGHWLNGGYEELVGWGLVTNVSGGTLALLGTVLLARYVMYHQHAAGVAAVLAIAAGAVCNPRSLFGVVLATVAIALCHIARSRELPFAARIRDAIISIGVVGGLAFLIAAPVVTALLRYSEHYFFLHYQFYDPLSMYWDALVTALSTPVLIAAIACGVLVATVWRNPRVTFALAIATAFYSVFTIWVARTDNPPPLVEQLEAPRLMPYQRLAMIALAAVLVVTLVQWAAARLPVGWREALVAVVVVAISMGGIAHMRGEGRSVPINEQAIYPVSTAGVPRFAELENATNLANDLRAEGESILVIGNQDNWWHEQLWAPGIANGTYYYDDWLWYWHVDQPGPYDPRSGYWMQNPTEALNPEYFAQHGIGVVMVSDMWVPSGTPPRQAARNNPALQHQQTFGGWDVYLVEAPASMVTRGDSVPNEIEVGNGHVRAVLSDGDGDVLVRQNWFPRWTATVNGEPATITRDDSGYMLVSVPADATEVVVELHYGVTAADWVARGGAMLGVIGLAGFAWRGSRLRPQWEVTNASA